MNVPFRIRPETARKALQEGRPVATVVELPLAVEFREGKEFFRNAEGQAEGVIDATFADVGWDYSALEMR